MAKTWEIKLPSFNKLKKDTTADVVIIGGGLAGLWCACLLSKAGKHVIVLEKDRVGMSTTANTTAFLNQLIDTSLTELKDIYSEDIAGDVWQSHREALNLIEELISSERIECEFDRTPLHLYARTESEMESLREEYALLDKLGFAAKLVEKPLPNFMTEFKNVGALKILDQAKYHPMKFFKGLVRASVKNGTDIYEKTEAVKISGRSSFAVATKSGKSVRAKHVIVATYEPFNNPTAVRLKKGMYESYVYSLRVQEGLLPKGMYIDQMNPYHYFRVDKDTVKYDKLIVGGEDHRAELLKVLKKKSFKALKQFIDETFPRLEYDILEKWDWGVLEPSDGLALIGEYSPGQYLATAFSGNGMTYSAIAGMIISDSILGKVNRFSSLYDPKRPFNKKAFLRKAKDYAGEFIGGAGKNIFK